ncbi:ABC transporter substrate-binding protein [Rhodococcus opacus]|uniref:ABC transporter substrate-binding protein n=1 Tax=Rhodococcus opacus TaxID=37919 RepID=UPI001C48F1FC|nr:extracellular solute-binding protein [Rhodococcus opacus]MBV6759175.1 extracellular solute-binding protein [Rhodococcus opacus]
MERPSPRATRIRKGRITASVAAALTVTLTACGGPSDSEIAAMTVELPTSYPADYQQIVDQSKSEGGELTIYSNTDQENWVPIFEAFEEKYPWVSSVNATNLDSDEVFQRTLSEQATGSAQADVVVSNAAEAWGDFAERPGTLLDYTSPEIAALPNFAQPMPNVYVLSVDPITVAYNTALLPEDEQPTGIHDLAELVRSDPDTFDGKIAFRDVKGAFGFTVTSAFMEHSPTAWEDMATILPQARPETSTGSMLEKVTSGEYAVAFFMGAPALTAEDRTGGLLKAGFIDDGQPMLRRGIGIPSSAPHSATAKLFLDYVLSEEGQHKVSEGGLTAYRPGIERSPESDVPTYDDVLDEVGAENVIQIPYTKTPEDESDAFVARWKSLLD